ncbi:hypothetical protein O6H91_20G073700 [Diphasiastrum complanatum]|uniref:Uncharacterized protein n=1 Tax=Diphasiastrum complanatum TaxID=34168 RepID=A0ACC2AT79_DIPCM|nr:hypothetical protein O6H91_20G073700 [Diphasiastrum complanatum]
MKVCCTKISQVKEFLDITFSSPAFPFLSCSSTNSSFASPLSTSVLAFRLLFIILVLSSTSPNFPSTTSSLFSGSCLFHRSQLLPPRLHMLPAPFLPTAHRVPAQQHQTPFLPNAHRVVAQQQQQQSSRGGVRERPNREREREREREPARATREKNFKSVCVCV